MKIQQFVQYTGDMKWHVKATDPPKPTGRYASLVAWSLAAVMLVMVLAHLIRIDKLIPIIGETLGNTGAMWFICLMVIAEVFALPYLLQMKLSPLLRVKSGLLVILVPLAWTCLTIWAMGNGHSTGQFSSYLTTPSSWWLIVLNLGWLAASYWVLRLLSFDKAFTVLRKKR